MAPKTPIVLTEALLIGRGGHKDVYADPEDFARCIKIIRDENDLDWKREMNYRRSRMLRGLTSTLLPAYYGLVGTTLGQGHSFERVVNYDGMPSLPMDDALAEAAAEYEDADELRGLIEEGLACFHDRMREEKIVTTNMEVSNFLIQRTAPDIYRVRVVDNIGSPVKIPLLFYIDALALSHIERYWRRFIDDLQKKHPVLITEEMKKRLL